MPVIEADALGLELGLGEGFWLLGALLAVPMGLGLFIEPWILAWSDRIDRRPLLIGALVGMAVAPLLAAGSSSALAVTVLLGVWGIFVGIAGDLAQGAVVSEGADRGMARWTVAATLGDLATPVLAALLATLGLGWRAGLVVSALVPLALAFRVGPLPPLVDDDEPLSDSIREAIRIPALWAWSGATVVCGLLDEVLLALVVLRLQGESGGHLQLLSLFVGSTVGAVLVERALERWDAGRLLLGSAALAALSLVGWIVLPQAGVALLAVHGAAAAFHYPLTKARTYEALPGQPGMVGAVERWLSPVDVALPLLVGAVVSTWGLEAGLWALLLQPAVLAIVALLVPAPDAAPAGPPPGPPGKRPDEGLETDDPTSEPP